MKDLDAIKVNFEYYGKKYSMTRDQIEAAYRYQEHQYHLQDAKIQITRFVFLKDEVDTGELEEQEKRLESDFRSCFGISYNDALNLVDEVTDEFEHSYTSDNDENSQWENAVYRVLSKHKKGHIGVNNLCKTVGNY